MKIALWIVQILLAFVFLASGSMKLFAFDRYAAMAPQLAHQHALVSFIGASELAGAAGLILPGLTGIRPVLTTWAAAGLGTIMVLATGFHLVQGEISHAVITIIARLDRLRCLWPGLRQTCFDAGHREQAKMLIQPWFSTQGQGLTLLPGRHITCSPSQPDLN